MSSDRALTQEAIPRFIGADWHPLFFASSRAASRPVRTVVEASAGLRKYSRTNNFRLGDGIAPGVNYFLRKLSCFRIAASVLSPSAPKVKVVLGERQCQIRLDLRPCFWDRFCQLAVP